MSGHPDAPPDPNKLRAEAATVVDRMQDLSDLKTQHGTLTAPQRRDLDALGRRARILVGDIARAEADNEVQRRSMERTVADTGHFYGSAAHVGGEERTYNPDSQHRGVSFLRDLANARTDPGAAARIARHGEEAADYELRDIATGAVAGLVVPQYLTDLVAPFRRAGRPFLDICNHHDLPEEGMTVIISRITTGSAVVAQATENAAVQETDMDDTLLTVNVRTFSGMQDVSRQAVDRGTGVEEVVIRDLARAYDTKLDASSLNDDGTAGTHLGIRSTAGIVAVTYIDATPTVAEAYPKLFDLVQQIQEGTFSGVSYWVMSPRRWWWFCNAVGTSFPFLQLAAAGLAPDRAGGSLGTGTYENGIAGVLGTVPVVLDANIPKTLGGGTEDVILGVTAEECHLWEQPGSPLYIRTDEALANQLSVRFVCYGYSAFAAGRVPGAHGTISGTGLIAPTFVGA